MLKGINQWCYPGGTSLERIFEISQKAGFDAVELNLNPDGDVGLTMTTTAKEAEDIVDLASQYGLKLRSLSTSLLWKTPLSDSDETVREQGEKVVEKQLQLAEVMGMDTVLVVPGVVTRQTTYEECYKRSQDSLIKLVKKAEQSKVKIGIENVWNKFLLSPMEMVRYIDELNSPYLGAYFDVGNVLRFGYPEQWIHSLNNRIFKVHVKDFSDENMFVPLLAGGVNWQQVATALKDIGYKDVITAEITPYSFGPEPLAFDTARHMDVILNSVEQSVKP
jgi:L-ribulose-5-phosphate 3-epimerase